MAKKYVNNAVTTLSGNCNAGATSCTVTNGSFIPAVTAPDVLYLTFENSGGTKEIIKVTAHTAASTTLTIVKNQESTGDNNWLSGDVVEQRITALELAEFLTIGKETIYIPAGAMTPRTTNGAAPGLVETTTNKQMFKTLDFDTTTAEYAQFTVCMPKSWNAGTVSFKAIFSHASGTGTIGFSLAGVSFASDDAGDAAFGTAVAHSALTVGTANDIYISAESGAVTITGAGKSEFVSFQVARDVATDTLGVDARLHGIQLFYTTDATTDE